MNAFTLYQVIFLVGDAMHCNNALCLKHADLSGPASLLHVDVLTWNNLLIVILLGLSGLLILRLVLNSQRLKQEKHRKHKAESDLKSCSEKQLDMEASLDKRDKIISILSHDIKAPLGHVKAMADMLYASQELKSDDGKFLITGIRNGLTNSITILDNVLLWIKRENGMQILHPETLHAENCIKENVDMYRGMMSRKRQEAVLIIDPGKVITDPNVFSLALRNLLSNAVKFSPETSKIVVWGKIIGTDYQIKVCDQGQGLDEDAITRLMNKKEGFLKTGTSGERGNGMGLSLVMDFLEKQGSVLKVESTPGKGCCFYFEVPLA